MESARDDEAQPEEFERHAPEGYRIAMQFFEGETQKQALKEATCVTQSEDLVAIPGHFHYGEDGEGEPEFRAFGWMVFERIEPKRRSRK
jgi:hypothetical protein